jgi:hypothetical protein
MAYNYDHIELVAGGSLPGGERWSCGFTMAALPVVQPFDPTPAQLTTFAGHAASDWADFFGTTGVLTSLSSGVTLGPVKAYYYPSGSSSATKQGQGTTAATGQGGVVLPNQCALVASLRSDFAGRSARGRIYLPLLAIGPAVSGAVLNQIAGAVATLIGALNTDASTDFGNATGVCVGVAGSEITHVIIDNIIDTQRRRRDKLVPSVIETASVPVG